MYSMLTKEILAEIIADLSKQIAKETVERYSKKHWATHEEMQALEQITRLSATRNIEEAFSGFTTV